MAVEAGVHIPYRRTLRYFQLEYNANLSGVNPENDKGHSEAKIAQLSLLASSIASPGKLDTVSIASSTIKILISSPNTA